MAIWDVPPAALADHGATQLSVDVNSNSKFAICCRGVLRGVHPVGAPGSCRFGYAYLMLLLAVAALADPADAALRAHFVLRGTFEILWIQSLLRALDGLGLFDEVPSCLEELLVRVQSALRGLAAPLPEQTLTGVDFNQGLTWLPALLSRKGFLTSPQTLSLLLARFPQPRNRPHQLVVAQAEGPKSLARVVGH